VVDGCMSITVVVLLIIYIHVMHAREVQLIICVNSINALLANERSRDNKSESISNSRFSRLNSSLRDVAACVNRPTCTIRYPMACRKCGLFVFPWEKKNRVSIIDFTNKVRVSRLLTRDTHMSSLADISNGKIYVA
jgi:hypothetical protein